MVAKKFLILITLFVINVSCSLITPKQTGCCEEYCYESDPTRPSRPQYQNLGQRNSYYFIRGTDLQIYNMTGCQAEKMWTMVRHGTRYPHPKSMSELKELEGLRDEIIRLYEDNTTLPEQGRLCAADLQLIKNWKWDSNITAEYDEFLTVSGWNEVRDVAQDYKAVYPSLIGNSYSSDKFHFGYTNTQRTIGSYKAFVEGLFGEGAYNDFTIDPPVDSILLNPQGRCDAYNENLDFQNGPDSKMVEFQNSEIFQKLRSDVSTKIGYTAPTFQPLSVKLILNIYEMCRFEKAWYPDEPSPWCAVLTPSQFKIFEYHEDLEMYMKTSYGSDVNLKLACAAMEDMLNLLGTNTSPNVVAYFAHIDNIHSQLTAMGAFKDTIPLNSDNFETMSNRKWKTSQICPFTSNLAAVQYKCQNDAEEKVKFFLNQKVLSFDWCDDSGVCKLSDVMEQYKHFRNGDCSEIFCSKSDRLTSMLMVVLISMLTSLTIAFM